MTMTLSTFPSPLLATIVLYGSLALATVLVVLAVLKKSVPQWAMWLLGVLELVLLVIAVRSIITWVGGTAPAEPVVFVCYLIACMALPPVMIVWARGEPGRWGSGAAAVALLVLALLMIRVTQVWVGGLG
jgi:hypothetical protein